MYNSLIGLRILYWNADGVHHKQQELAHLVSRLNTDVIAICKSRLTTRLKLNVPGYVSYRMDKHSSGTGQGVAILIRVDLIHSLIPVPATIHIEAVAVSLKTPGSGNIILISAYQSPNKPLLISDLNSLLNTDNRVIIMGDFNAKHPCWSPGPLNRHGKVLYNYMLANDLMVHGPMDST